MSLSLIYLLILKGNCGPITELVDVITSIICGFATIFKIIIPRINKKKLATIIDSAIDDWKLIVDEKSLLKMKYYAFIGKIIFILQMSGAYATGFQMTVIRSLLDYFRSDNNPENYIKNNRVIPIGMSCWLPTDVSLSIYFTVYVCQTIQLFFVCSAYIGGDTFFFGFFCHVWGQLKLLQNNFDKLNHTNNKFEQKIILSEFVKRHNHLLKIANYFEDTYHIVIFVQVGTTILLTSITGFVSLII